MAAITARGNTWDTNAGNKTVTVAPAVGDLIVVLCANSGRTAAQPPTMTDNNSSGTYDRISTTFTKNTSADSGWVFIRTALITSSASTIFTMTQTGDTGGGLAVFSVSGMTRFGFNALRQAGKQDNAAAGTPSIVMPSPIQSANPCLAQVMNGTNGSTTTAPPSSWSEAYDSGYTSPANGREACFRDSGETNTTLAFTGASASAFGAIAVELDISQLPITDDRRFYAPLLAQ